jgi:hypothetical protein
MALNIFSRPRHEDAHCPRCGESPLVGPWWACHQCGQRFDLFSESSFCPACGAAFETAQCPACGQRNAVPAWYPSPMPPAPGPAVNHR